jgi:hypothetical protein
MPVDWYRTPDYDEVARGEFGRRYSGARHPGRIQYKKIKALHLMLADEPGGILWAQELLTEVTADPDAYVFERAQAFEVLARIYRRAGRWQLAVEALEQAIELASPTMNGTCGVPDLTLAEILLESDQGGLPRAAALLRFQPLIDRIRFNSDLFRYLVATARTRQRLGQDPADPARRALDLLENDKPAFPRHPDVGRVHADAQTVSELHGLAGT